LRGSTHYQGTILINPDGSEDEKDEVAVNVQVDILGYAGTLNGSQKVAIHTVSSYDDEDENEDANATLLIPAGSKSTVRGSIRAQAQQQLQRFKRPTGGGGGATQASANALKYQEHQAKYGTPGSNNSDWHPPLSTKQQLWLPRIIAIIASFMAAGLWYTFIARLPGLTSHSILPPNPWFVLVLVGIIPAATLGAIVLKWDRSWTIHLLLDRLCTGMISALLGVGVAQLLWQDIIHFASSPLQLFFILLVGAIGAVLGISPQISDEIVEGVLWAMRRFRIAVMVIVGFIGAGFGLILALSAALSWLTFLSILICTGIALALVFRVDWILKQNPGP
ncbi:MAG: hypothetical protein M3Z24_14165, partial [Chloroflexota bacterium]|nr:hypothetical protein [Chloroflexota bacterium]